MIPKKSQIQRNKKDYVTHYTKMQRLNWELILKYICVIEAYNEAIDLLIIHVYNIIQNILNLSSTI